MQNINFPIFSFSRKKLLAPMCTRVPLEIQELVDELADSQGIDRAKWIREAIDLKVEMETGQSSVEHVKKSKNTAYSSVFKNVYKNLSDFFSMKKPDIAGRA